jgi:phage baseplate assembly protein W
MTKFININYPFKDSSKGFFLDLNSDDAAAIKADLMHLILTRKGERLYNPDFGTDLLRFIFEPQDGLTLMDIKTEITTVVKRYLPKLQINEISVVQSPDSEHAAVVTIKYTITDDVFTTSDLVIINI